MEVTYTNGNKQVTTTVTGTKEWTADTRVRVYYNLETTNKRRPIGAIYEVIAGGTRDCTLHVNGRTFGYQLGVDATSNSKRNDAFAAVQKLIDMIVTAGV